METYIPESCTIRVWLSGEAPRRSNSNLFPNELAAEVARYTLNKQTRAESFILYPGSTRPWTM